MSTLLQIGLSNAIAATLLALIAAALTPFLRQPKLRHALWLLVLVKLVTPPMFNVSVPIPEWMSGRGSLPDGGEVVVQHERTAPRELRSPDRPINRHIDALSPLSPRGLRRAPFGSEPQGRRQSSRREAGSEGANRQSFQNFETVESTPDRAEEQAPSPQLSLSRLGEGENFARPRTSDHGLRTLSSRLWTLDFGRWTNLNSLVSAVWLGGTLLALAVVALRVRQFRRLIAATEKDAGPFRGEVDEVARAVGLRRCPPIRLVEGPIPPLVWSGSLRPLLLLPRELLQSLSLRERRLLMAHELMHVRRGDHLVRWFQMLVLALYWWHPVAWWTARRLQQAEEECCDAAVLALCPEEAPAYAATLLATCEFLAQRSAVAPLLSSGFGRQQHLKRRLNMILDDRRSTRLSKTGRLVFAAFATFAVAVSWNAAVAQKPADATNPSTPSAAVVDAPPNRTKTALAPSVPTTPVNFVGSTGTSLVVSAPVETFQLAPFVPPMCQPVPGQVSDKVRKQIVDKLMEGTNDADPDVARQSLEGIARVRSSELATQALLAILEKPAPTEAAQRVRLDFANRLLDVGIARERVLDFLLKTATRSEYALVRSRAIGLLSYAKAPNKSPDVVRMLVATAEKPQPAPPAAAAHAEPGKSTAPPQTAEARGSDRFPADPDLIQKLINQAQRPERIGTADGIFVPRQYDQSSIRRERRAERVGELIGDERRFGRRERGDVDQKLTRLMGEYNEAIYAERWGDAERIANLFVYNDPKNPNGSVMQQQVKERRQVAQLAHPDRVVADGGFAPPDAVARLAIERTLPEIDDVAVVLIEALKNKNPKIRRAATTALANAVEEWRRFQYREGGEFRATRVENGLLPGDPSPPSLVPFESPTTSRQAGSNR